MALSSTTMVVSPAPLETPKMVCWEGRRKSQSTRITLLPPWAMVMARLARAVDLPSSGPGEVTTMVLMGLSKLENSRLVRSVRNASLAGERGLAKVIKLSLRSVAIVNLSSFTYLKLFKKAQRGFRLALTGTTSSEVIVGMEPSTATPT